MRKWLMRFLIVLAILSVFSVAYAVAGPVKAGPAIDWKTIIAGFINTTLVVILVQILLWLKPIIVAAAPWLVPIIASVMGIVVSFLQNWLTAWLGVPIDLSPLLGIFTGFAATGIHQVYHQRMKQLIAHSKGR